jgi:hypothetical protein
VAQRREFREDTMKRSRSTAGPSAPQRIDRRIAELEDWRGETLSRMRRLIKAADPRVVEEWKWSNPVWSHDGIICTGESYRATVKLTFIKGASLPDPARLFNSSLGGSARRAIDIRQGERVDAAAFKALIRAAVALNSSGGRGTKPVLLAGGNPQIAKADGAAPVRAYIAAMPGWKRAIGRRLDALIARTVPGVRKAVRWNSPFYGLADQGWFLSFHVFSDYVKVAFFRGASLRPVPPGKSKHQDIRYLDIHQDDELDEARLAKWVRQAAALPGWGGS